MFGVLVALLSILQVASFSGNLTDGSVRGVDVSVPITQSAAECFKSSGLSYVVPRGYRSIGEIDYNVCESMRVAASAGIETRDTYIFPCPTCAKNAFIQMTELVSHLEFNCKSEWSGRIWLDIEGIQYWYADYELNKLWYKELVDSCAVLNVRCGVYASTSQWKQIFGTTEFVYGNDLPLWYAHYDGKETFDDFTAFGGWNTPHAKQTSGDATVCGIQVDEDWGTAVF